MCTRSGRVMAVDFYGGAVHGERVRELYCAVDLDRTCFTSKRKI